MQIVVAGASGLLGTALTDELRRRGHDVTRLVRRAESAPDEARWDPHAGEVDDDVIAGADVVVNTAGASLLGLPYSKRWQRNMRESRINTTRTLAESIARAASPPAFLAGNASGYYGDHGSEIVTEQSDSRGHSFLTEVAKDWQAAAAPAVAAGARVCILRTAPVADRRNPLLRLQVPIFSAFLGARLSDGTQFFPIISLRDWVGAAVHLAEHGTASGPFNLCAPETPTNAAYTTALAEAVGRRAFLAAPAPLLRIAAGPMAPEMLSSVNMRPVALEAVGYEFRDRDAEAVLAAALA